MKTNQSPPTFGCTACDIITKIHVEFDDHIIFSYPPNFLNYPHPIKKNIIIQNSHEPSLKLLKLFHTPLIFWIWKIPPKKIEICMNPVLPKIAEKGTYPPKIFSHRHLTQYGKISQRGLSQGWQIFAHAALHYVPKWHRNRWLSEKFGSKKLLL